MVHWCRSAVTRWGFESRKPDSIWVRLTGWWCFWELGQTDSVMGVLIDLFFNKQKETISFLYRLEEWSGWRSSLWSGACSDWRRRRGQFRPPYQLCTVPKSASAHADTCSLTHTAVARIQSVHATHCCVLQVWWECTDREWWWCTAINKASLKKEKRKVDQEKGQWGDKRCVLMVTVNGGMSRWDTVKR